jgi:hypothetical protein
MAAKRLAQYDLQKQSDMFSAIDRAVSYLKIEAERIAKLKICKGSIACGWLQKILADTEASTGLLRRIY